MKQVLTTYLNHSRVRFLEPTMVSYEESWSWPLWDSNSRSRGCEADNLSIWPSLPFLVFIVSGIGTILTKCKSKAEQTLMTLKRYFFLWHLQEDFHICRIIYNITIMPWKLMSKELQQRTVTTMQYLVSYAQSAYARNSRGESEKRSNYFFTYIHLDLFRSHPLMCTLSLL